MSGSKLISLRLVGIVFLCLAPIALDGASASASEEPVQVRVNWTNAGIFPQKAPSMTAGAAAGALADGTTVTVVCEQTAEPVDNGNAVVDVWDKLPDGSWLPNAFLDTGVDGRTAGVPDCSAQPPQPASPTPTSDTPKFVPGSDEHAVNGAYGPVLLGHYFNASGTPVVLDWLYFANNQQLAAEMKKISTISGTAVYAANPIAEADLYSALGNFTIGRSSEHCYYVYDRYDFRPDKVTNYPFIGLDLMRQAGKAQEFEEGASGCFY